MEKTVAMFSGHGVGYTRVFKYVLCNYYAVEAMKIRIQVVYYMCGRRLYPASRHRRLALLRRLFRRTRGNWTYCRTDSRIHTNLLCKLRVTERSSRWCSVEPAKMLVAFLDRKSAGNDLKGQNRSQKLSRKVPYLLYIGCSASIVVYRGKVCVGLTTRLCSLTRCFHMVNASRQQHHTNRR